MSEPILVKDLFDLPESVRKSDFVVKLTEGVTRVEETVSTYVVTPNLADAFERAVGLVGGALTDHRSRAAYLHGSFGSGKSHFMAILSLMLDGHEAPWRIPELHPIRARHAWPGEKRVLQLRFHMIGQTSFESAIFGEYTRFVKRRHPDAPQPALFADTPLFDNAAQLLETLGDERFFAAMGGADPDYDWGDQPTAESWDRRRFEETVVSTDPAARAELFSDLVKSHFPAFTSSAGAYVELDQGLGVLSRHAAELGYEVIVLFLDELILWLAGNASDAPWINREAPKIAKLVEAQDAQRDIAIVSFIARQRDLVEMVGEEHLGADQARLRTLLEWWEGRLETLHLPNKNLPAIVEKRVLRPCDDAARATLDDAFTTMRRGAGSAYATLLASDDTDAFRKLYPFSPAVVEALVALSSSLQRERTAIRLLMELLVEHTDDLELGDLVLVGDLFDILAGGDDTADGVMKARFDDAKELYRRHLLPLIQRQFSTATAERCQRLRDDHPIRLGCSGCRESGCRSSNRLAKTLLIASLVPEVSSFKNLTASRLVELNHGSVSTVIAGTESSKVTQALRKWSSEVGQIHVGQESDPRVRVELGTVDVEPILAQAGDADSPGRRQQVLRDMLFDELGLEPGPDSELRHTEKWHATDRKGTVRFGNVRKMGSDQLRTGDEHDWRLVIDYPFDDPGHGPHEDVEILEKFMNEEGAWTLVWLPSFFSEESYRQLGELVRLEHVLETRESRRRYLSNLSLEQQQRALDALENLRNQKKNRLREVIRQSYGLSTPIEGDLDASRQLERHLWLLQAGAAFSPGTAATLDEAFGEYVRKILETRYPRHPKLTQPLTSNRVKNLLAWFNEILEAEDKQVVTERKAAAEIRGTLEPLGLVRVIEDVVHLREDQLLDELEQMRHQHASETPSVGELRRWLDEDGRTGLTTAACDLVIRLYARWSNRTLTRFGKSYDPGINKALQDDAVLEKPDLPTPSEWSAALDQAGAFFGVTLPRKVLHAENLKRFEDAVLEGSEGAASPVEVCARLPGLLQGRLEKLEAPAESADRLCTARSVDALLAALAGKRGAELVRVLAAFEPETSGLALGKSLRDAESVSRVLADDLVFGVFRQLAGEGAGVKAEILDEVRGALRQDQLNVDLAERLKSLARAGQKELAGRETPPPSVARDNVPPPRSPRGDDVVLERRLEARGRGAARERLREVVEELDKALDDAPEEVVLDGSLRLRTVSPESRDGGAPR